jgi:oligopeptide transport system substrate-binding protein
MLYEGLTKMTPESPHAPGVAKRYEVSEDGKTYTFYLRDCKWSNGDPITSEDFAASWKAMLDPVFPSPNANLLYQIKNAEARKMGKIDAEEVGIHCPNSKTLVVELENPTPYFLKLTSFCALAPTNRRIVNQFPSWADNAGRNFVCNGPFYLHKFALNDQLLLVKNRNYWNAKNVKLENIVISLIDNENTVFDLYEQGALDMIGIPFTPIPVDYIQHLKRRGDLKMFPIAATLSFFFNTQRFPFTNRNIRKAFGLAVNRRALVDNISQMGDVIGVDNLPPVVKRGRIAGLIKDDDIVQAKECFKKGLEEIGITKEEFPSPTLLYSNKDLSHKIVQVLQETWLTKLGVSVKLERVDFKVYLSNIANRNFSMGQGGWIYQYDDLMNVLDRYKYRGDRKNQPGWENQEYINLLNASMLSKNEDERYALLENAEAILVDEMPTVALYHLNNGMLFNPHLKGVYISPTGLIHLENAYFK